MLSSQRCLSLIVCGLLGGSLLGTATGCRATTGWAFNNSGKGYYQRGQYAMAREEFCRATSADPMNPDYRHNLALAMKKTGDLNGAETALRQNLTQVSAMHEPSYHSLAQILVEQSRQGEAQLLAGWAETQPYVPEANVEYAWIQRQTGNTAGAEQSLRRALQTDPRHPTALAHLGQLYQDSGQPDRAVAMYQRSLASRWGQPEVQSRLQTASHGAPRPQGVSRSAMMMNSPYGPQPMMFSAAPTPMMSSAPPTWTAVGQPVPTNMTPIMAAAPVLGPTPDLAASAIPAPIPAAMPSPMMADVSSGITFETPILAGPVLTPNADPAHAQPEMTAELPLVDPR